jgi:hypothetical protein
MDSLERPGDAEGPERPGPSAGCCFALQLGQWMVAMTFVVCSPITLATLLFTTTMR